MRQVALLVILLFAFSEREGVSAFRARNLDVWHVADLPGGGLRFHSSSYLGTQANNPSASAGHYGETIELELALNPTARGARVRTVMLGGVYSTVMPRSKFIWQLSGVRRLVGAFDWRRLRVHC